MDENQRIGNIPSLTALISILAEYRRNIYEDSPHIANNLLLVIAGEVDSLKSNNNLEIKDNARFFSEAGNKKKTHW